jgi:hypothetical protein
MDAGARPARPPARSRPYRFLHGAPCAAPTTVVSAATTVVSAATTVVSAATTCIRFTTLRCTDHCGQCSDHVHKVHHPALH